MTKDLLVAEMRKAVRDVCGDFDQDDLFVEQLETYLENLFEGNLGPSDLQRLIESVSLDEEFE